MEQEAAGTEPFLTILTAYGRAIRQWKSALLLLREPNGDRDTAQKMLALGDKLRADAFQQFDNRYARPRSGPGSGP